VACYEQSFEQHLFDRHQSSVKFESPSSSVKGNAAMAIAVVIPGPWANSVPASQIYARRRLIAGMFLAAIVLVLLVGGGHVVANRGGAPASAPTVRPANAAALPTAVDAAATASYVVQPGDTLWSIGERFHGQAVLADYVDALVAANGGTQLQVSQPLALP
jgi:LysM repeat protein